MLQEPGTLHIVIRNKQLFEPYGVLVDSALSNLHIDMTYNLDAFSREERNLIDEQLLTDDLSSEDPTNDAVILGYNDTVPSTVPTVISDDELNATIRSLNPKQREYFEIIYCFLKIYHHVAKCNSTIECIYYGAWTSKSHLIQTICHSLTKVPEQLALRNHEK